MTNEISIILNDNQLRMFNDTIRERDESLKRAGMLIDFIISSQADVKRENVHHTEIRGNDFIIVMNDK